jgi:hypothetical protein
LARRFDIGHLQITSPLSKRIRDGSARDLTATEIRPLYRRVPWTPLLISIVIVLSSGFAVSPIRDASSLADISEAYLARPLGYVVLAPLSDVLDTLTLLSARQHAALLAGVLLSFIVWRIALAALASPTRRQHLVAAAASSIAIIVVYAAAAVLPRPMAALVSDTADIIRIDFHSHTAASHDGRPGWSVEDNRSWHRDGGYDVVYVTDHATVAAAEQGMAQNVSPAGEGVTVLQGIEVTWTGEHVAILGAQRRYRGILTANLRDVDEQGLRLASLIAGREPVVIWNHPHQLSRLPAAAGPGTPGVRGIEVSNGAPDSMDEDRRQLADIVTLAQQKDLTMTAGSDNHGWGSTAPNWTLMLIFGWRGMAPDSLALRIDDVFRKGGFGGARAVERRVAGGTSGIALALTLFSAPARMLTTLSNDERISWLIWIWLVTAVIWWIRRNRTRSAV